MTYKWCHGPNCHKSHTLDRVRGGKGNKVLRTRKIRQTSWNAQHQFSHFCSQGCWNDFAFAHWEEFIRLHPRDEPLETPIEDPKKVTRETSYGYTYTNTEITVKEVPTQSNT